MGIKLFISFLGLLLLSFGIDCSNKRGLLSGITRISTSPHEIKSNIEFMNEDVYYSNVPARVPDIYQHPYYIGRYQEIPFRVPIWPLSYGYIPSNVYSNEHHQKDYHLEQTSQSNNRDGNKHEHFHEKLLQGLTYEVTEHINRRPKYTTVRPTKKPIVDKHPLTTIKGGCGSKVTTHASHAYPKEIEKEDVHLADVKPVEEPPVSETLESGPDVMLSDSVRTVNKRGVWKREIKPSVSVHILLDGALLNTTEGEVNVSQYLTKLFEDLDHTSLMELISTLKNEYLSSATPAETVMIEETFEKLVASLNSKKTANGQEKQDGKETLQEEDAKKTEIIAEAATLLELLAEESSIKDDLSEDLPDETYQDYYGDTYQENDDETSEPSFLELVSIATKHKATKTESNVNV